MSEFCHSEHIDNIERIPTEEADRIHKTIPPFAGMLLNNMLVLEQSLKIASKQIGKSEAEGRALLNSAQQIMGTTTQKETIKKWGQVKISRTLD